MTEQELEQLTRQWILMWNDGDPTTYPLAQDFQHISPYGRIDGRDVYLNTVIPLSKENVAHLTVEEVVVTGNQSAIRYHLKRPSGETIQACDWLTFNDDKLSQVSSYYQQTGANG